METSPKEEWWEKTTTAAKDIFSNTTTAAKSIFNNSVGTAVDIWGNTSSTAFNLGYNTVGAFSSILGGTSYSPISVGTSDDIFKSYLSDFSKPVESALNWWDSHGGSTLTNTLDDWGKMWDERISASIGSILNNTLSGMDTALQDTKQSLSYMREYLGGFITSGISTVNTVIDFGENLNDTINRGDFLYKVGDKFEEMGNGIGRYMGILGYAMEHPDKAWAVQDELTKPFTDMAKTVDYLFNTPRLQIAKDAVGYMERFNNADAAMRDDIVAGLTRDAVIGFVTEGTLGSYGYVSEASRLTKSAEGLNTGARQFIGDNKFVGRKQIGYTYGGIDEGIVPSIKNKLLGSTRVNKATLADDYANLINSNKPWSWVDDMPGGADLSAKQRAAIKQEAIQRGLIPDVPMKPGTKYPDFESVGLIQKVDNLPEELWKASDSQQFNWLDKRIPGGRPEGTTWHHSEIPGRMELVPFGPHNVFKPHLGGRSPGNWAEMPGGRR